MLLIVLAACTSQRNMSASLDKIIKNELGTDDYQVSNNESEEYMLCYTVHTSPQNVMQTIKYIVCDKSNNHIVIRGSIKDGSIGWISKYEVEIVEIPGLAEEGRNADDYKKIINVKSHQK